MIQTLLTAASFRRWRERSLQVQVALQANSALEDQHTIYPPLCEPVLEEFSDYISELFMQEFVYPSLNGGLQPERSGAPFTWNSRSMSRLWAFITSKAREMEIPLHYVLPLLPYLNGVQTFRTLDSNTTYALSQPVNPGAFYRFTSTLPYLSRINNVALNGINSNWPNRPEGNTPVMSSQLPGYFCAPTDYINKTLFVAENMLMHSNALSPTPLVCKVVPDLRSGSEFPITVAAGSYRRVHENPSGVVPALQAASIHFWGPGYYRLSTPEEIEEFFQPFLATPDAWIGFGGRSVENIFDSLGYSRNFYNPTPAPAPRPDQPEPVGAVVRTNAEVPAHVPRRAAPPPQVLSATERRQAAREARRANPLMSAPELAGGTANPATIVTPPETNMQFHTYSMVMAGQIQPEYPNVRWSSEPDDLTFTMATGATPTPPSQPSL